MNREDIIRMAREAQQESFAGGAGYWFKMEVKDLERFAALVAAAERESWPAEMEAMERQVNILTDALARAKADEREACAQFLESTQLGSLPNDTALHYARLLKGFAEGIRARGQA